MRIAFAIFRYFPHGGLARDLRKIASECVARGHAVRIYAMTWQGERPAGAEVVLLPSRGVRGHVRQRRFAAAVVRAHKANPADLMVGMNKMPGLDAYYAGDVCFVAKMRARRQWWHRLTPRYRHFAGFERAVFAAEGRVRVLTVSPPETHAYARTYGTPAHRLHSLPPGLERGRAGAGDAAARAVRRELGIDTRELLLLFVGSGFRTKGLDRALRGFASLPKTLRAKTRFCVAGADRAGRFRRLARRLGVAGRVCFLGGRDDVPALLRAADGLVLPAYSENTGTVILESAAAGLPALVTANCGYAAFVEEHGTGIVTAAPFDQSAFNADLQRLLTSPDRAAWAANGRALGRDKRLYAMAPAAVDLLEEFARASARLSVALCAFDYAPTAPQHRALAAVAAACQRRGMDVRVYACACAAPPPASAPLVRLPVIGWSAAGRLARYQQRLDNCLRRHQPRCVVGFDAALHAMDIRCEAGAQVAWRARGRSSCPATQWSVAPLPPGIGDAPPRQQSARPHSGDAITLAMVGGDLAAHGVDRLFAAIGKLPAQTRARCQLVAAGFLADKHLAAARAFGMAERVSVRAGADPRTVVATADVFVELAFRPSANGWIFDAMTAGAAVLTHDAVAEARLVREAEAGVVLPAPFRQGDCDRALARMLAAPDCRRGWRANAARFAAQPRHYGQAAAVAERIAAWLETPARGGKADAPLSA